MQGSSQEQGHTPLLLDPCRFAAMRGSVGDEPSSLDDEASSLEARLDFSHAGAFM
jgi:hypothetical protein